MKIAILSLQLVTLVLSTINLVLVRKRYKASK